jgi:hypothetical protein
MVSLSNHQGGPAPVAVSFSNPPFAFPLSRDYLTLQLPS